MKVIAYIRVSTERQVKEGFGLEAQRDQIRRWAKEQGHRVVQWCADEGVSGANGIDTRVGLYEALAAIKARNAEALVVTSLDRLARQMTQQEGVLAQVWMSGGKVISLDDGGEVLEDDPDDPMRTAVRQMRGVFAQLERGLIRQRMAKGKKAKAAEGGYVGGAPPFGFRSDGRGNLLADDAAQESLHLIANLRASGASLREIIAALNSADLRPPRGGTWHPTSVARILRRLDLDGSTSGVGGEQESGHV